MQFYWHIELYGGEIIKIKPENAQVIQELVAKQQGAITTPTRSIVVKDIKDFRLSDEPYSDQKLIEGVAQAFNEPRINKDGSIQSRWVKKSVPKRMWEKHYKYHEAYRALQEADSFIMIAFLQPVHQIDHARVQELSPIEELKVTST